MRRARRCCLLRVVEGGGGGVMVKDSAGKGVLFCCLPVLADVGVVRCLVGLGVLNVEEEDGWGIWTCWWSRSGGIWWRWEGGGESSGRVRKGGE